MIIILRNYDSPFFPVAAYWNNNKNCAVYKNIEEAKNAMIGRFGDCMFINKMEGE